ncbi:acyl-CoA thioesterase [Actinomadura rugatobispora]|uniref:Acyl-CoA thioesterase n=1 Tax=Actinomadura rugatobispora TaxID=1994 RepID=A0ABW0ZTP5_9ACTN|nr:acyl-CoA thioesterase II [Actinomadura rugatobispora]
MEITERPGLARLLTLEPVGGNLLRAAAEDAPSHPGARLFGGQVAAQALMAAGHTVPADRAAHSAHGHFLRAGDPRLPVDYRVEEMRAGSSFTTRRVVAEQNGAAIFLLTASFQVEEEGLRHQTPRSAAPDPETLPPAIEAMASAGEPSLSWFRTFSATFPLDLRFDGELPRVAVARGERRPPKQRFWLRSARPLGDDALLHAGAAAFATDVFLLSSSLPPHGLKAGDPGLVFASLDHTVWFHRPFRADEWFLYDQESFWADRGRALCRGLIFDREGVLVATVMQEALVRAPRTRPGP